MKYLQYLSNLHHNHKNYDPVEVNNMLDNIREMSTSGLFPFNSFFVADYRTRKYAAVSARPIWGYQPQAYIEGGVEFLTSLMHKNDFAVFNKHIFSNNLQFIKEEGGNTIDQLMFTQTYRVKAAGGNTLYIQQTNKYVLDAGTGIPLFSYGTTADITDFKTDTSILWKVTRLNKNGESSILNKLWFFPDPETAVLTQREKEILNMLSEGHLAKEIAHKLRIAYRTVVNHRQNMFRKTNTRNIAELVKYGHNNRLI